MFITARFPVAQTWTQPKCPLIEDWIKKIWCIYTVEYYSAIRKDNILPFVTIWMDLENIMLSEVSHSEKAKNHMMSLIGGTRN